MLANVVASPSAGVQTWRTRCAVSTGRRTGTPVKPRVRMSRLTIQANVTLAYAPRSTTPSAGLMGRTTRISAEQPVKA